MIQWVSKNGQENLGTGVIEILNYRFRNFHENDLLVDTGRETTLIVLNGLDDQQRLLLVYEHLWFIVELDVIRASDLDKKEIRIILAATSTEVRDSSSKN